MIGRRMASTHQDKELIEKDRPNGLAPKKMSVVRKVLKALRSVKLAISLLAIIGVVLIVATLLKNQAQARRYIYHSWWFISLLGLFCLNLLLCTAGRWSFAVRRLGTSVTHAGVLVMVAGVLLGAVWGERGLMQLYIGEQGNTCYVTENEKMTLPFVVHLEDFKVERYGGRHVQQKLVVKLAGLGLVRSFPVEVGRTFRVAGTPYSVTTVRYEPDFVILDKGVYGSRSDLPRNPAIQVRVDTGPENRTEWVFAKFPGLRQDPDSEVRLFYQRIERIRAFKSKVQLLEGERVVASKTIEVNKPLKFKGYSIFQSGYDEQREMYSVLEIARDPGVPFVYAGFMIISAGVVFNFYFRPLLKGTTDYRKLGAPPRRSNPHGKLDVEAGQASC